MCIHRVKSHTDPLTLIYRSLASFSCNHNVGSKRTQAGCERLFRVTELDVFSLKCVCLSSVIVCKRSRKSLCAECESHAAVRPSIYMTTACGAHESPKVWDRVSEYNPLITQPPFTSCVNWQSEVSENAVTPWTLFTRVHHVFSQTAVLHIEEDCKQQWWIMKLWLMSLFRVSIKMSKCSSTTVISEDVGMRAPVLVHAVATFFLCVCTHVSVVECVMCRHAMFVFVPVCTYGMSWHAYYWPGTLTTAFLVVWVNVMTQREDLSVFSNSRQNMV